MIYTQSPQIYMRTKDFPEKEGIIGRIKNKFILKNLDIPSKLKIVYRTIGIHIPQYEIIDNIIKNNYSTLEGHSLFIKNTNGKK